MPKAPRVYFCSQCNVEFSNRTAFNQHNLHMHTRKNARDVSDNALPTTSTTSVSGSVSAAERSVNDPRTEPRSGGTSSESSAVGSVKPFKCTQCPAHFTRRARLNAHIEEKHSDYGFRRKCPMCKLLLNSQTQYDDHTSKCGIGRGFVRTSNAFKRRCTTLTLSLGDPDSDGSPPVVTTSGILGRFGGSILRTMHSLARRHGSIFLGVIIHAEFVQAVGSDESISIPLRSKNIF